ncbi:MAG: right-handed parallel beta-helix repeat-containing protein [Planctomycetota bacterium]
MVRVFSSLLLLGSVMAAEIHVAPGGADDNAGSADAPLATLRAARDALRSSGALGAEPCTVVLHAGTHRLREALRLGVADSGSAEHPVLWRAAEGAAVTISGAQVLNLDWQPQGDGSYRATLAEPEAIDQLFVNGQRQILARYPNQGAGLLGPLEGKKAGHTPYDGASYNATGVDGKAKEWANPRGAFLHGMHRGLWGSIQYRILGVDDKGELVREGGWQNNRISNGPHHSYWMIEGIREELDAPGEWFHAVDEQALYYRPAEGIDLAAEVLVEAVFQLPHLIECYGDSSTGELTLPKEAGNGRGGETITTVHTTAPVKHLRFAGLRFTGTARTFMGTAEPLLRSDWSIYRGGAIHLRGTEDVAVSGCVFNELGGNAVFVDGYNRAAVIRTCDFSENGASDINFVGSPAAVRTPAFGYEQPQPDVATVDREVGPKTDDYPADCVVEDCLMTRCGRFEKQVAGVNISMASRITVSHNTIHHTPRAGINVCDGTWGGHQITWNDVFETVLETHDHGAFNSWGRDRFWHQAGPSGPNARDENDVPLIVHWLAGVGREAVMWDAYQTTTIAYNRMQCDHGWDIDLDDGSTNYDIHHNLCLSGGLKTREGYRRHVDNNVIFGRGYTCNVPYPKPTDDLFTANILWGGSYSASSPTLWGGVRDANLFHNPGVEPAEPASVIQFDTRDDARSLIGNADFRDVESMDFRVNEGSPALTLGFDQDFPAEGWGVSSAHLRARCPQPPFTPGTSFISNADKPRTPKQVELLGAVGHELRSEDELTATGMFDTVGVLLDLVPAESQLAQLGFRVDDVLLKIKGRGVKTGPYITANDIRKVGKWFTISKRDFVVTVWREQREQVFTFTVP